MSKKLDGLQDQLDREVERFCKDGEAAGVDESEATTAILIEELLGAIARARKRIFRA